MVFCTFLLVLSASISLPVTWVMPPLRNTTYPLAIQQLFEEIRFPPSESGTTLPLDAYKQSMENSTFAANTSCEEVAEIVSGNFTPIMPVFCVTFICFGAEGWFVNLSTISPVFFITTPVTVVPNVTTVTITTTPPDVATANETQLGIKSAVGDADGLVAAALLLLGSLPGALCFVFLALGKFIFLLIFREFWLRLNPYLLHLLATVGF
jgi:hypothetical protein